MKTVDMAEGRGPNPYYAGNFDGESDELRDLRLSLVAERDALKAELERIKALEPVAWLSTDCIGERYLAFGRPLDNDPVQPLYALGSKTA